MCIIAVCEKRHLTPKEVKSCFSSNPDGAGIAWQSGDSVIFRKGFMKMTDFEAFYRRLHQLPHVVHFRNATHGDIVPELTHPFLLGWTNPIKGRTKKGVLFHNGIISSWREMLHLIAALCVIRKKNFPDGLWSDSRALAVVVSQVGTSYLNTLTDKFVVLTPKSGIQIWGSFIEEKGIRFSNTTYKGYTKIVRRYLWDDTDKYYG